MTDTRFVRVMIVMAGYHCARNVALKWCYVVVSMANSGAAKTIDHRKRLVAILRKIYNHPYKADSVMTGGAIFGYKTGDSGFQSRVKDSTKEELLIFCA